MIHCHESFFFFTFFHCCAWLEQNNNKICGTNGFGGLGVACWPLVSKFAGSNAAEAVGFLGRKNSQHAFLRRGSKALGPMS